MPLTSCPQVAGQDNGRDRDQRLEIRSQDDGDRDGGLSDKRIVVETADMALHPGKRETKRLATWLIFATSVNYKF